jgi:hypothetical protein
MHPINHKKIFWLSSPNNTPSSFQIRFPMLDTEPVAQPRRAYDVVEEPVGKTVDICADVSANPRPRPDKFFRERTLEKFLVEGSGFFSRTPAFAHGREAAILVATMASVVVAVAATIRTATDPSPQSAETEILAKATEPICRMHTKLLPHAYAAFGSLGFVYLLSGGWPGTFCVKLRGCFCSNVRIATGVAFAVATFGVADLLAAAFACSLVDDKMLTIDGSIIMLVMTSATVIVYAGSYARFALDEADELVRRDRLD